MSQGEKKRLAKTPRGKKKKVPSTSRPGPRKVQRNICVNAKCKLRKAGCSGFEGCPGYMGI